MLHRTHQGNWRCSWHHTPAMLGYRCCRHTSRVRHSWRTAGNPAHRNHPHNHFSHHTSFSSWYSDFCQRTEQRCQCWVVRRIHPCSARVHCKGPWCSRTACCQRIWPSPFLWHIPSPDSWSARRIHHCNRPLHCTPHGHPHIVCYQHISTSPKCSSSSHSWPRQIHHCSHSFHHTLQVGSCTCGRHISRFLIRGVVGIPTVHTEHHLHLIHQNSRSCHHTRPSCSRIFCHQHISTCPDCSSNSCRSEPTHLIHPHTDVSATWRRLHHTQLTLGYTLIYRHISTCLQCSSSSHRSQPTHLIHHHNQARHHTLLSEGGTLNHQHISTGLQCSSSSDMFLATHLMHLGMLELHHTPSNCQHSVNLQHISRIHHCSSSSDTPPHRIHHHSQCLHHTLLRLRYTACGQHISIHMLCSTLHQTHPHNHQHHHKLNLRSRTVCCQRISSVLQHKSNLHSWVHQNDQTSDSYHHKCPQRGHTWLKHTHQMCKFSKYTSETVSIQGWRKQYNCDTCVNFNPANATAWRHDVMFWRQAPSTWNENNAGDKIVTLRCPCENQFE